jgi:DNA repair protein RadD
MPESLILRPRQLTVVDELRGNMRSGRKRNLLYAPTGGGKTIISAFLAKAARERMTRTSFVVDRISLVDQTSAVFDRYGIDHGVVQAGHWRRRGYEPIQVASVQTVEKRGFFPDLNLLIVDECHIMRKSVSAFIESRPDLNVIGLSATPFAKGLGQVYENLVSMGTTNDLIAEQLLVPVKYYCALAPDMTGAKVVAGEWAAEDIGQRGTAIVGDVAREWEAQTLKEFGGPVKTIVFCATVAHGERLCQAFAAKGYRFELISYMQSDEHKAKIIEAFRPADTEIHGLVSCAALQRGFDVPDVLCGISAHPYRKSFSSHIQERGRVMRTFPGKEFALWLDHSGNIMRFWADQQRLDEEGVTDLSESDLDSKVRKEPDPTQKDEIRCSQCKFTLPPRSRVCPSCGHERPRPNTVIEKSGTMILVGENLVAATGKHEWLADRDQIWLECMGYALAVRSDLEQARRFAFGAYKGIYGAWPRAQFDPGKAVVPREKLFNRIKSRTIAYAKRPKALEAA